MDDLETLRRWEEFGAAWEIVQHHGDELVISLRRCDGGEEVSRLVTTDPTVLAHVDGRSSYP